MKIFHELAVEQFRSQTRFQMLAHSKWLALNWLSVLPAGSIAFPWSGLYASGKVPQDLKGLLFT
jgi:hypothetical protein